MSPEQSPSKIGKSVGEKLRAARIAQHYTQSQLAAPDFSVSYISAIERGQIHPSLRALEILAGRLGLTSTQLLPTRTQQQEDHQASPLSLAERDDDEIEFTLLEAQILIRQGEAGRVVGQLEKLISKRLKRQHQLQHRYLLGWAYFKVAQFQECDAMLTEALQLAKDLNAHYLHVHILNLQALAYAAMRNYAQALLVHQRCLNQLESGDIQDPFFTAQVYMSMGQHYTQLENFDEALEVFHKAIEITSTLATAQEVQSIYGDLCQYYAASKETNLATLYAHKCTELHSQEASKRLRSEVYYYLGQAMLKVDQEKARAFLDEAQQNERLKYDVLTQASIAACDAEWYIMHQDLAEAEKAARRAREQSSPCGDTIIGANALLVLGRIEYAQKKYKEGDQHFTAGLDMLGRLGSHEELVDESVRYAELLEQAGKAHEAFTYFRRAFQSQQKLRK
ncbi:MAG TPA: helix-turn-helix domain-containing protein [Ktedonosporobacter sp.]|nr:helix-turn-helix domain-containing protein [Ktedonosporobacter sp.]